MLINVAYDPSLSTAPAGYQSAVQAAVLLLEKAFVSPITVNLSFAWDPLTVLTPASAVTSLGTYSYSSVIAALHNAAAGDSALANEALPASDPFLLALNTLTLSTADARQLGLSSSAPSSDGTITLNSGLAWNWDPDTGSVTGKYNAVTAILDEITQSLGRFIGYDGVLLPAPLSLFRYTAPGTVDNSLLASGYLSLNGGQTDIVGLGTAGGEMGGQTDSGDAFNDAKTGAVSSINQADFDAMAAIGFNPTDGVQMNGGNDVILNTINNNAAVFTNSGGNWDSANGVGGTVLLWNDQASIVGGGNAIVFYSGLANAIDATSLYSTGGTWDSVTGHDGLVTLNSSQASVTGGGDQIFFDGSPSDAVSLYGTNGAWDTVKGSSGAVTLNGSQASVVGGGDFVYFDGLPSDAAALYGTNGAWDTLHGSNGLVTLVGSQASIVGGNDTIYFDGSSLDTASLYNTNNLWDTVQGSNGMVLLNSAQSSIIGGGNAIGVSGAGTQASLYATGGVLDTIKGTGETVILNSAQANVIGGAANVVTNGTGDIVNLNGAADSIYGSNSVIGLTNSAAALNGASNTLNLAAAYGVDAVSGFVGSDVLGMSKSDWANFSALQSSGAMTPSGANTIIKHGSDVLTLIGVAPSSLNANNFTFT